MSKSEEFNIGRGSKSYAQSQCATHLNELVDCQGFTSNLVLEITPKVRKKITGDSDLEGRKGVETEWESINLSLGK